MRKKMRGYIYVPLLLSILVTLGFVLSGGLILSEESSSVGEITERYILVDKEASPPNQTLQLSTLDFTAQACRGGGYDIALVIDNSGSIGSDITKMKEAMKKFTATLLGSSTQFSVTRFDTTATVLKNFTDNFTEVNNAIDSITIAGTTNWEDALIKAKSTLDDQKMDSSRLTNQDLVIFASDGNPNHTGSGVSADESVAVANAVTIANQIKTGGARILTLGIGDNINIQNLQKISGSTSGVDGVINTDVISTDFDSLAADLATLTVGICGP